MIDYLLMKLATYLEKIQKLIAQQSSILNCMLDYNIIKY